MGRKLTRRVGVVAAALLVMALAACDTQPATDVTDSAATLNAKGACTAGASGTWEYQVKRVWDETHPWTRVGPQHGFSCAQNTGEVNFTPERARYLRPNTQHAFRLVSRLSNGAVQTWDANGTNGGTAYDTFTTQAVVETELPVEVTDTTSSEDPVAVASGCRSKEINNPRKLESWPAKTDLVRYNLRTRWRYCNGQVARMYTASTGCNPTSAGALAGYYCANTTKVRAVSLGGNPEHVVWTYSWDIRAKDPTDQVTFFSKTVCASNYASGSNVSNNHYRNGRCQLVPWGT